MIGRYTLNINVCLLISASLKLLKDLNPYVPLSISNWKNPCVKLLFTLVINSITAGISLLLSTVSDETNKSYPLSLTASKSLTLGYDLLIRTSVVMQFPSTSYTQLSSLRYFDIFFIIFSFLKFITAYLFATLVQLKILGNKLHN